MNPSRAMSAAMLGAFARATMRPSEMKTQSSSAGRGRVGVRIVFGDEPTETSKPARNPKRRAREAAKALKQSTMSTMAQRTLASRSRLERRSDPAYLHCWADRAPIFLSSSKSFAPRLFKVAPTIRIRVEATLCPLPASGEFPFASGGRLRRVLPCRTRPCRCELNWATQRMCLA